MFLGNTTYDDNGDIVPEPDNPWAGAVTALGTAWQLQQLASVNAQRAAQGLPPIDMSALAPQVNIGLPPAQLKMIMLLGVGIVAAIYLSRKA